jgi:acylphosphatase
MRIGTLERRSHVTRTFISISGLVQGIGFRPFVYRIAVNNGLKGYVKNLGDAGVEIDAEGDEDAIKTFLVDLEEKKPPLAIYTKIDVSGSSGTLGTGTTSTRSRAAPSAAPGTQRSLTSPMTGSGPPWRCSPSAPSAAGSSTSPWTGGTTPRPSAAPSAGPG